MVVAATQPDTLPTWVQWVSALAPFFTLLAALVAGTIAVLSLQQRRVADAKEEWWTRFAWASDLVLDARPERQEIGVGTLTILARSDLAHAEELELVDTAWGSLLDEARSTLEARPDDAPVGADPGVGQHAEVQRTSRAVSRAQVLAARGRQVTDARLQRTTEAWVERLAATGAPTVPGAPAGPETRQSHRPDAPVTRH